MFQRNEQPDPDLEDVLQEALTHIQVDDDELVEARTRRDWLRDILKDEFPGSETYVNGSVAHGDALTPLTDVDVGVVVAEAVATHGPGKRAPMDLMQRAADAIESGAGDKYPDLAATVAGQTHAVLINFRDPVTRGQEDFTADVLVTVDNAGGKGLFIPDVPDWERSDPQGHTAMVKAANTDSKRGPKGRVTYARDVRLVKHWCRNNGKPLCSWNIKAIALKCLNRPMTLLDGLDAWFACAHADLSQGPTEDPSGVSDPIEPNESLPLVLARLEQAQLHLRKAREYQEQGYPLMAQQQLAQLFNDEEMLPTPQQAPLMAEAAQHKRQYGAIAGFPATTSPRQQQPSRRDPVTHSWRP